VIISAEKAVVYMNDEICIFSIVAVAWRNKYFMIPWMKLFYRPVFTIFVS
jgi:hypothetical protein